MIRWFAADKSKPTEPPLEDLNKPIDFLQSPAAQWKAQWSTKGVKDDSPWFEPWVILASVTIFMVYFCYLREESDIDQSLKQPLYDSVPEIEQKDLIVVHKFNATNGKDNREVERRMKELGMNVAEIRKQHYS